MEDASEVQYLEKKQKVLEEVKSLKQFQFKHLIDALICKNSKQGVDEEQYREKVAARLQSRQKVNLNVDYFLGKKALKETITDFSPQGSPVKNSK